VRKPLALAALDFAVWNAMTPVLPPNAVGVLFNLIRITLMIWAGWLAMRHGAGLQGAAQGGIAVILVDHLVLRGGMFLVQHALGQSRSAGAAR
jgi:hypothetical protein